MSELLSELWLFLVIAAAAAVVVILIFTLPLFRKENRVVKPRRSTAAFSVGLDVISGVPVAAGKSGATALNFLRSGRWGIKVEGEDIGPWFGRRLAAMALAKANSGGRVRRTIDGVGVLLEYEARYYSALIMQAESRVVITERPDLNSARFTALEAEEVSNAVAFEPNPR